jgi:hypothetical protein
LSFEASPTSSFAVGIFTKVFPSLLFVNPLGGHVGDGDGVKVGFALAKDVTGAAVAIGIHINSAKSSAITLLITIPLKFANTKVDSDC